VPWHGNRFNVPVVAGIEGEAGASEEATTEAVTEATTKQGIITVGGIDFHHASEAEFARLLDYYGIDWQYEPNQFPLQWRDGRPVEMFRPDFYLTEYDLYIELTTMRQALVRRKNRKLRLLRALYPEINIKLLYRRDYQRLLERFGIRPEEIEAEAPVALQDIQEEVEAEDSQVARAEPRMRRDDIA
jgi:hypoxanthine phosphoribosyltransferase